MIRLTCAARTRRRLVGGFGTLVAGGTGVAVAANHGKITPVSESHVGATQIARTIMANKGQLLSGRWAAVPPDNHPNAVSTEHWLAFPGSVRRMRS